MARRLPAVLMAALVLVAGPLAGCGDDDDDAGRGEVFDTTTESDGTPTTEATSTSQATTTSSTATTTTSGTLPDEPPFHDDSASGSGCTPGPGVLPDGWWYGTLDGPVAGDVTFDLACYYVGAAAEAEAASRGDEVNNDYYVVNDNPTLRTMPVTDDATASCVELGAGVEQVDCAPTDVDGEMWAVWLRVQDGEVDRIVEQYAP